jgi:peptidoglycan/xylan/chitin deacetylase (PgdA/CDA1 family)
MNTIIRQTALLLAIALPLALASACTSDDEQPQGGTGGVAGDSGGGSNGGSGGTAAPTSGAGGVPRGTSIGCLVGASSSVPALPVPPGAGDLPAPSGTGANLRVLPWAGFGSAVSYTFDDTQPSQIDHWPELKAEGIRVTFYANPPGNWYAGYDATWKEAIAQGCELGNHTISHCHADLTGCNNNQPPQYRTIDEEIDQCSLYLTTRLGQAGVWTFADPYGDTGYEVYARDRFILGRGVGSGMIAASGTTDPFNLPVMAAVGGEAAAVFNGKIDAARAQSSWLIFLFHSILPTSNNWYAGVDIASITGSMEYGKAFGDVWLDSVVNIGAYWLGMRAVEAATPVAAADATTWTWSLPACFPPGHVLRVTVDGGTLSQGGVPLPWNGHGYYELTLDAGTLTWTPS